MGLSGDKKPYTLGSPPCTMPQCAYRPKFGVYTITLYGSESLRRRLESEMASVNDGQTVFGRSVHDPLSVRSVFVIFQTFVLDRLRPLYGIKKTNLLEQCPPSRWRDIIHRLKRHTIRLFVGRRYAFYTLPELVYTVRSAINILAAVGFPFLRTVKYVHALARRSTRFDPRGANVDRTAQSKRWGIDGFFSNTTCTRNNIECIYVYNVYSSFIRKNYTTELSAGYELYILLRVYVCMYRSIVAVPSSSSSSSSTTAHTPEGDQFFILFFFCSIIIIIIMVRSRKRSRRPANRRRFVVQRVYASYYVRTYLAGPPDEYNTRASCIM